MAQEMSFTEIRSDPTRMAMLFAAAMQTLGCLGATKLEVEITVVTILIVLMRSEGTTLPEAKAILRENWDNPMFKQMAEMLTSTDDSPRCDQVS